MANKPHRIDVHFHTVPPAFREIAEKHYGTIVPGGQLPQFNIAQTLEAMDINGIATVMSSVMAPGIWLGDVEASRKLARECNEYAAQIAQEHPGRFGSFANLPLPDTDGSLAEIEYALDVLATDGFVLMSTYDDRYLGDPRFAPVFAELNRRKAAVYIHPTYSRLTQGAQPEIPALGPAIMEFAFDATRTIVSLLLSGTLERCPNIRFIVYNAGGTVPFLAQRLTSASANNPKLAESVPQGAMVYLKRLYYDVAGSMFPYGVASLLRLVPPSHLLFGTDGPRFMADAVKDLVEYGFAESDLYAIERGNALELFPRLATL